LTIFIDMKRSLWTYVKWMISENTSSDSAELITEPDIPEEDQEQEEQSIASSVAGVTTPLGTDATYPNSRTGHKKSPERTAGDSFGGARPPRKKHN
jgi:hypothetical protein